MARSKKATEAPAGAEPTTEPGSGFEAMEGLMGPDEPAAPAPRRRGPVKPTGAKAPAEKKARAPRKAKATAPAAPAIDQPLVAAILAHYSKAAPVVDLMAELVLAAESAIAGVEREFRQQFLGLSVLDERYPTGKRRMVLSVIPMKADLKVVLPLDPSTHSAEGARDVSALGHWGVGGLEIRVAAVGPAFDQAVTWAAEAAGVERPAA